MNIHVIIGTDDFLIGEIAGKVIGDGVGLEVVDSINASNADLQLKDLATADSSFSTPPFLDPRKVTWWKNVAFLPGGKSSEEVKKALDRFAEKLAAAKLPENQHFILSGPHLLKTSIFAKRLASAAEIVDLGQGKPWERARAVAQRVSARADEMGLAFAPGALEQFIATVGTDMRSLVSELGKMRDYLGNESKAITAEAIAAVTSGGVQEEPEVWGVTDALAARDLPRTLEQLRRFEGENGFAVFLSGVIERQFRQLVDVKAGRTEGMNPYVVGKLRDKVKYWSLAELRRARARFLALREKVVSGTTAGDVLVVTELVRALRRPDAKGAASA